MACLRLLTDLYAQFVITVFAQVPLEFLQTARWCQPKNVPT